VAKLSFAVDLYGCAAWVAFDLYETGLLDAAVPIIKCVALGYKDENKYQYEHANYHEDIRYNNACVLNLLVLLPIHE
jgi:hypothetical protein